MAGRDRPESPARPDETSAEVAESVLAEPALEPSPVIDAPVLSSEPSLEKGARSGGGFLPALAGGALAAAVGFGLSHFNLLGIAPAPPDLAPLAARLSVVEDGLKKAGADIAALREMPAPASIDPALLDRIAALENSPVEPSLDPRLDPLISRMDALEAQLSEASSAGTGVSGAALAALQTEVRALKSATPAKTEDLTALVAETKASLAEAEAKASALTANAQAIANAAKVTAALGQLRAALDTGQAYTASLALLDGTEIPAALSDFAETGLPTLASLQAGFPTAARAALEAALRADPGEGWTDRVGTFLRSQTGARSLTPREGTDPDAILSRAEAALGTADLDAALREVSTLPPEAQAAMADWTGLVERRRAAAAAIMVLAAKTDG